jgi:hypothetical protein
VAGQTSGDTATPTEAPAIPLLLISGFAASALALVAMVTAEHYLRRRVPEKIASYALAWSGQWSHPAVGLAVVRGAFIGLAILAFETLLGQLTLLASRGVIRIRIPMEVFAALLDPAPVADAMESFSPALYAAAAALLDGVLMALVLLGLLRVAFAKRLSPVTPWYRRALIYFAMTFLFAVFGFHLYLAQFIIPFLGAVIAMLLEVFLLVWLLERFDVLTILAAVATAILWVVNYPLLAIFQTVGNGAHWAVFWGWAAIVALAAASASRPSLANLRRRIQAAAG